MTKLTSLLYHLISRLQQRPHMNQEQKEITKDLLQNNQQIRPQSSNLHSNPDGSNSQFQFHNQPKVTFPPLKLIILGPILAVIYLRIAWFFGIPLVQYSFITCLSAFLVNYIFVIRKFGLMTKLPIQALDHKLRIICGDTILAVLISVFVGCNGSGGALYAFYWQATRGRKINIYKNIFFCVIVGSILIQDNTSIELITKTFCGLLFGYANSQIYILKDSNPYTIINQFTFFASVVLPLFYPGSWLLAPSLFEWFLMIASGCLLLVTLLLMIKSMQNQKVSVVLTIFSGIIMVGTASFSSIGHWIGSIFILVAIAVILKKQFIDQEL